MRACQSFAAMLFALGLAGPHAAATTLQDPPSAPVPVPAMEVGGTTRAPIGFVRFCREWPEECAPGRNIGPRPGRQADHVPDDAHALPALTPKAWRELERIDAEVDHDIIPQEDRITAGTADRWSLSPRYGDCEDYALTKRHRLLAAGWPPHALLLAVVRDELRGPHAVLVVRTSRGDMVLDNLARRIVPWHALAYRWVKRQSTENPRLWVKLDGYADEMVERLEMRLQRLSMHTGAGSN